MRFLSLQSLQLVACDKQHILVSQLFSDTVVSFLLSLCGEVSRGWEETISPALHTNTHNFHTHTHAQPQLQCTCRQVVGVFFPHSFGKSSLAPLSQEVIGSAWLGWHAFFVFYCLFYVFHMVPTRYSESGFFRISFTCCYSIFSFLQCFCFQLIHGK